VAVAVARRAHLAQVPAPQNILQTHKDFRNTASRDRVSIYAEAFISLRNFDIAAARGPCFWLFIEKGMGHAPAEAAAIYIYIYILYVYVYVYVYIL
jgi:hypothetical protein